jgi:hypothetical protein
VGRFTDPLALTRRTSVLVAPEPEVGAAVATRIGVGAGAVASGGTVAVVATDDVTGGLVGAAGAGAGWPQAAASAGKPTAPSSEPRARADTNARRSSERPSP